ncbi:unnamed protein product [Discosporangium mesarthrocarpum]
MGLPGFYLNPQYALVLSHLNTTVHIQLEAPKDYPINITLLSRGGHRVDTVGEERTALSSGAYRQGFCYLEGELPAGAYTIVVSTYKARQMGGFVLKVSTSSPPQRLSSIPPEGDGMDKQVIQGWWREDDGSAAGCSNYQRYLANPRYGLTISNRTALLMRLALPENAGPFPSGRPALNVSVYRTSSTHPPPSMGGWGLGRSNSAGSIGGGWSSGKLMDLDPRCKPTSSLAVATSNEAVYTDCLCGTATKKVDLDPGGYVVVVSTFQPLETSFLLTVYSSPRVDELYQLS